MSERFTSTLLLRPIRMLCHIPFPKILTAAEKRHTKNLQQCYTLCKRVYVIS